MKFWQSRYNPQMKLSQQDLLTVSEEISRTFALPLAHHQPELVLMAVDPTHLYAYWNLQESQKDNELIQTDKQLALRIYTLPELSEHHDKIQLSFDIKVHGFKNQQKVPLPVAATAYSAIIGEINTENSFIALANSDIVHVPRSSPVTKHNSADNEAAAHKRVIPVNHFVHLPCQVSAENEIVENTLNSIKTTGKNRPQLEDNFISQDTVQNPLHKAFILKNFNNYGYDLKVYERELGIETLTTLALQGNSLHPRSLSKTIDNYASDQGHKR